MVETKLMVSAALDEIGLARTGVEGAKQKDGDMDKASLIQN